MRHRREAVKRFAVATIIGIAICCLAAQAAFRVWLAHYDERPS